MEYFIDDSFFRLSGKVWDKNFLDELFECLEDFKSVANARSQERRFTEFFVELKIARNKFLDSIKDLKMIMNCRVKGNSNSHFGGQECAEFADAVQQSCSRYLSFSVQTENFVQGSIEYLILNLRNKARKDEKYAWEEEKKVRQDYLSLGVDNTLKILKESGYNF